MYLVPLLNPYNRFVCLKCGRCCRIGRRDWLLQLSKKDLIKLNELGFNDSVEYVGHLAFLKKTVKGTYVFLDRETNLCLLRKEYNWYPLGCRLFPFSYYLMNSTLFISINRSYLESVGCLGFGKGKTLGEYVDDVLEILRNEGIIEDYYIIEPSHQ